MKPGCILMAAGAATRFAGGNKLLAEFLGCPVFERALDAIPAERFCGVAVVSGDARVLDAAKARGFIPVLNDAPQEGASRTVSLGVCALQSAPALLFMVADQPALRADTVRALLDYARRYPEHIIRPRCQARPGNPVLFPRTYYPELLALQGDTGGGAVCRAHPEALRYFEIEDARELADVDSREALSALKASYENEQTK